MEEITNVVFLYFVSLSKLDLLGIPKFAKVEVTKNNGNTSILRSDEGFDLCPKRLLLHEAPLRR